MASKAFERLERAVEREYRRKGFSPERARYIGRATAGKVARQKEAKKMAKRHHDRAVHKPPREQTHAERLRNLRLARAARRHHRRRSKRA